MDVDNGSYKLAASMLNNNRLPAQEGIRIEEFINAMNYDYQHSQDVFALSAEVFPRHLDMATTCCTWASILND